MKKLWQKLSSKPIYKNPWVELIEDQVIRPDGTNGIYSVINIPPGIAVLPIDENNFVYLIEEYHYPSETMFVKTVSGGIEENETPEQAARRELKEELGITAEQFIPLGTTMAFTSAVNDHLTMFVAKGLSFGKPNKDENETFEPIKFKLEKAVEMVISGEITNGNTCVLLLKAYYYLNS